MSSAEHHAPAGKEGRGVLDTLNKLASPQKNGRAESIVTMGKKYARQVAALLGSTVAVGLSAPLALLEAGVAVPINAVTLAGVTADAWITQPINHTRAAIANMFSGKSSSGADGHGDGHGGGGHH